MAYVDWPLLYVLSRWLWCTCLWSCLWAASALLVLGGGGKCGMCCGEEEGREGKEGQGAFESTFFWEPCFSGDSSRLPSGGVLDPGTSAGQDTRWWCTLSPPSQEGLCVWDLNQWFSCGWQWPPFIFVGELSMEGKWEQKPLCCRTNRSEAKWSLQGEVYSACSGIDFLIWTLLLAK